MFPDASEEKPVHLLCDCGHLWTITAPPGTWPLPCPECRRPVNRAVPGPREPGKLLPERAGPPAPREGRPPAPREAAGSPAAGERRHVEITRRSFTGRLVTERVEVREPEVWSSESLALALWLAAALGVVVGHSLLAGDEFTAGSVLARSVLFALVTTGFLLFQTRVVRPALLAPASARLWMSLAFFGIPVTVGAVLLYFHFVEAALEEELIDPGTRLLSDPGSSLPLLILAIGVLPGVFEELGFRGWMQSTWRLVTSPGRALVLTACAFAVMHFSVVSLGWLLPMGLYLGWLREASGSVWPGVVAHIGHNSAMVLLFHSGGAGTIM